MIYNLLIFLIALCCILFYIIWKTKKNSKHKNNLSSFEGLEILILSATETGNARKLAENLNKALAIDGFNVQHYSVGKFTDISILNRCKILLFITSTYGEGEIPNEALKFYKNLKNIQNFDFSQLQYCVFGLGDSSYKFFCKAAENIDYLLRTKGAIQCIETVKADVYYDEMFEKWKNNVMLLIKKNFQNNKNLIINKNQFITTETLSESKILDKICLSSNPNHITYSISLEIDKDTLNYLPGDVISIVPENDIQLVHEILSYLTIDEKEIIIYKNSQITILDALKYHFEISICTVNFIKKYAEKANNISLIQDLKLENTWLQEITKFCIADFIIKYPVNTKIKAQDLITILTPLSPRKYSISSSQSINPDRLDITLKIVQYNSNGKLRRGAISNYLNNVKVGDSIKISHIPTDRFQLPKDSDIPIIMIGTGTGIAPFRAFLQQRKYDWAKGKNWLLYGHQFSHSDFLYKDEINEYLNSGLLSRLDTAWSRDQESKVYVQDILLKNSKEIYSWITKGAIIYVCGNAKKMAIGVDQALIKIISKERHFDLIQAREFINHLIETKHYQKDIY